MITYHITLNQELANIVEQKIKQEKYANKSEFFRSILRRMYVQNEEENVIEAIKIGSAEYKKLLAMSKEKNSTRPYSEFLKSLEQ